MKCQFCSTDVPEWDKRTATHFVATESLDGHIHTHGPIENKEKMAEILQVAQSEAGIVSTFSEKTLPFKEIIFHNRQRIGDMFMFTCGVRDFKKAFPNVKVNVISTCGHIWDNNPYIDRSVTPFYKNGVTLENAKPADLFAGNTNVLKIGPSKLTNSSNRLDWHFANAFRMSIEDNLGVHIPQGESRGDIWFTKEEYNAPRVTEKPYWIIITGGEKGWGCKMYPTVRWQEVIDQNPDILFYQLGAKGDDHVKLTGPNVVDYIGKTEDRNTGIRDLFNLFLNAEGSIGLVSFHMHLSGALKKPCVVIAGGREPVSFTRYAGHQYIANDGCLPCSVTACWHCDPKACTNPVTVNGEWMPKCIELIDSSEVSHYLNRYYKGGRLNKEYHSEKPKVNIGVPAVVPVVEAKTYNTYGLTFNGGAVTERDWEFIQNIMKENHVESVLEFGGGLSTLLLSDVGLKELVTYEDKQGWIDKLKKIKPGLDIRLWDGKTNGIKGQFDLAFVDGPAGDSSREMSTKIASEKARVVIVHDAGREWARKYQDQYLVPGFTGPIKGGHRCHAFVKNRLLEDKKPKHPIATKTKTIKFVSTARGWGGCARSITTIMSLLMDEGHKVEFIPFRNSIGSSEFQQWVKTKPELRITTDSAYSSMNEHCDVLVMYADDYIWEFKQPQIVEAFSNINADKKIMVLNYRRGDVGKVEWTKGWDKYMFLNKSQEDELLKLIPGAKTKVLAPCTDLSAFFMAKPNFDESFHKEASIRIVRHSSQGDTKFSKDCKNELDLALASRPDLSINMMPGPSFVENSERFSKILRNKTSIPDFLETGNLFWYSLPKGYLDMGPRVIIEAMAAGLPILADNWGGAVDRVTPDCGWLCNTKEEMIEIIKNVTLEELKEKGEASRKRAKEEFHMDKWIKEIVG